MKTVSPSRIEAARKIFERHGGIMRTSEAMAAGVHPEVLYAMRDTGVLKPLARGLYHLTAAPDLGYFDLVTVSMKIPRGVICMLSALSFHELTTHIPKAVDIGLTRGSEPPRIEFPPIHVYWSVENILMCGVEKQILDGKPVQIHNPERALVGAFRYRNKIGMDTALEALKLYRETRRLQVDRIMEYARICRVAGVIRPYLEATL